MRLNLVPFIPKLDVQFANAVLINFKRIRELFNTSTFTTGDYKWSEATADHPGWLLINVAARSLPRRDYPALFGLIGTKYGAVDVDHFNLPPAPGRTLVAAGQGTGLTNRISGQIFGTENHLLISAEMPSHTHTGPSHTHTGPNHNHSTPNHNHLWSATSIGANVGNQFGALDNPTGDGGSGGSIKQGATSSNSGGNTGDSGTGNTSSAGTGDTGSAGGNTPHNNMQPSLALNLFIHV